MDPYAAATSWALFGGVVAFGCWYYYPRSQTKQAKNQDEGQNAATARRKKNEQHERGRPAKRSVVEKDIASETPVPTAQSGNGGTRKRKAPAEQSAPSYAAVVHSEERDEDDMSTKKWAEGMMQAQKGHDIGSTKTKESRVKTVKQSSALSETPQLPAGGDEDSGPGSSRDADAGRVSDMLEPTPKGPSTLRITAPAQPQKDKVARKAKEEVVESKKQRQNRKKVEERRVQHEAEEAERKKLEENQRRTARESRGEPAKNGIPIPKAPATSVWTSATPADGPIMNERNTAPLLDTFDAESMSSSNGGMEASTGPTSTTSGGAARNDSDLPSEEEQMAQAMKQSEDESGWTTVAQPKKSKKKAETPLAEPMFASKTNLPAPAKTQTMANGKPVGFQALEVQYEQRTDADPNDASNWDA